MFVIFTLFSCSRVPVVFDNEKPFIVGKIVDMRGERPGYCKFISKHKYNEQNFSIGRAMIIAPINTWEMGDTIH